VLGKIFKRRSVPDNDGMTSSAQVEKLHYTKFFELELSNMEDTPVYALTHQISIGSEIGNIIISDPSVSPRHATFILQQEVVSVIDHGSVAGTSVNGTKITPGKYIILEESDVVRVGDLELRIKVTNQTTPEEVIPEPPVEEEELPPALSLETDENIPPKKVPSKKEHLKVVPKEDNKSANSVVRLFAVIGDLLLSYSVLVIFLPFDQFREFLEFVPSFISSNLGIEWTAFFEGILQDAGFAGDMLRDGVQFISNTFQFGPLLIVFILLRLFSTLLIGTSVSEFFMGRRSTGNALWARVGGVIRVIIGIFTGPLIIFDMPAIISKRTLKEFLTFTNLKAPSKWLSTLGIILGIPALIGLALLSPLIQGLEAPRSIVVDEKIEQRAKVKIEDATEVTTKDHSDVLKLDLKYDPKELLIIPNFKFYGVKSKLNLKSSLVFYQRDLKRSVEFETFKNFDFRQLLGIGIKGNVLLYEKYPQIYNFVYEAMDSNPAFKTRKDSSAQQAFANEFIDFTKSTFAIGTQNVFELMQNETFIIKGLIDYKSSFLSLIEYKDFDQIGFIKLGNTVFMKISYLKQKPFDLIIPLIKGEGRIFKVTFDGKEDLGNVSSMFYKFNFDDSNWLSEESPAPGEVLSPFGVFDYFTSGKFQERPIAPDLAQAIYGYYFETSREVLTKADLVERELWTSKVKNIPKLIEAIPYRNPSEGFDPKIKLQENFRDMIDALENNNTEYFGMSQTTTL
jgi:hypothetical protein